MAARTIEGAVCEGPDRTVNPVGSAGGAGVLMRCLSSPRRPPRPLAGLRMRRLLGMSVFAVTVLGHDRPGIVAETTAAIADLGGNLEDSSMTLLRGHFAMTLVATVQTTAAEIEHRLGDLSRSGLVVTVLELPAAEHRYSRGRWVLSVHGADRPGIVSAITAALAGHGGNVVDLSTRLSGSLYVLIAEVEFPTTTDPLAVQQAVEEVAGQLGVEARLRPSDEDVM